MHIDQFIGKMEEIAPPELAEDFDENRIGLIVEGAEDVNKIYCALDVTPYGVERCIESGAEVLVVHHTPIWKPINCLRGQQAQMLGSILSSGMNVYVMHTNFDHACGGINDTLASCLGLKNVKQMSLGIVGQCSHSIDEIAGLLGVSIRVHGTPDDPGCLAVVGGSGFDPLLMEEAVSLGADAFLSAELKHSIAREAPLLLLEATHYALEAPGMRALGERNGWEYIDDPPLMITTP